MATVAKTVYYAWPTLTASSAVATLTGSGANQFYTITASLGTKTLYFPETSSRSFKSVGIEIGWMDGRSVVQNIYGYNLTIQISGSLVTSSYNYLSNTAADANVISNTGENWAMVVGPFDFTSYFNSNTPAQSSSIDVNLNIFWRQTSSIGAANTSSVAYNYTAKLFTTYEHEDTDNTYIKTAIIPFNSPTSSLGITGINSTSFIDYIPQLTGVNGFLPESNVTIRDYFIEIEGNETTAGSTNIFLTSSITSSTYNSVYQFGLLQRALSSDRFDRFIYSIPTSSLPDTTVTHSLNLAANITSAFRHICPSLYVTYEYDKTSTTKILNTIILPQTINSPLGYTVEASASSVDRTFKILDNNLELKQSALRLNWFDNSNITSLRIKTGGQSSLKTYTDGGSQICGMKNVQHRIDSGAEYGSGFTLVRGLNEISSSIFTTSTSIFASNINGFYIINYHSDVPSIGIDNSTKFHIFSGRTFTNAVNSISVLYTSSIPLTVSSSTYIIDNGTIFYNLVAASQAYSYDTKILSNENNGLGYENIYNDIIITDSELGSSYSVIGFEDYFARYSQVPSSSYLNPWINRQFRVLTFGTRYGFERFINLSRYTYPLSGSIYNYTDDGSGYIVDIYDDVNNQLLYTLTTTAGGKFNTTWYDDTNLMYAKVTTPTQYGISNRITVTGSFDVYLIPFEYGYSNI